MRGSWRSAGMACGAGLSVLCGPATLAAAPCDQFNPSSPAGRAQITLNSRDFVDERRQEMRTFIDTGSLGQADASVVSSTPPGIIRRVTAAPELSRFSRLYGEQLKGVAITVSLGSTVTGPATVVLDLRQVCAEHFRDTVLYY